MLFGLFPAIIILIGVLIFIVGGRILWGKNWILGWLRGCLGVCLVVLSITFVMAAMDLFSYQQLLKDRPIGTISISETAEQEYEAKLSLIMDGSETSFVLRGDQWQLDARMIRWRGLFLLLGAKPGYRLDRISGRYYSLEDERRKDRTVHQLTSSEYVDTWAWFKSNGKFLPIIDASYGSATYLPMVDGALYEIGVSSSGLVATPINSVAQEAIQAWQ